MANWFKGKLKIDAARGVVYFHTEDGNPILRIEGIPTPIENPLEKQIDIRLLHPSERQTEQDDENATAGGIIRAVHVTTWEEVRRLAFVKGKGKGKK